MLTALSSIVTDDSDGLIERPTADYLVEVERARREWIAARDYFENVTDPDLVDYAIYQAEAAEKKYMYLLKQIKKEGNLNM
jgi:hypothetical protein